MRIRELIDEGYGEATTEFGQHAATDVVKKTINTYRDLVNRNQVQGNERNIDWWRKQGWESFAAFVNSKSTEPSATQIKRRRAAGTSITLKETDQWLIVIPLDHEASCFHGRNTDWCTARPTGHHFDEYFLDKDVVLIYCLNKQTGSKWAIASHPKKSNIKLFDEKDKSITKDQFKSATSFDSRQLIALIPHNDPRIAQAKQSRRELLAKIQQLMVIWKRSDRTRNAEIEQLLIQSKHPELCSIYVVSVGERHGPQPFPPIIAMAAVNQDGRAIQYIANPSEAVQLVAVKQYGYAIQYITNPSEAVQQAAVNQNGSAIQYIANPSKAVQLVAVKQYGYAIQYITNPSEAVQQAAVNQNGSIIYYIKNPSEAVQLAAVKQNGHVIQYIENPSEAVQLVAVKQDGRAIHCIKNPSEAVQQAAVKQDVGAIQHIENPSEAVQLAAVKQYGYAIQYIANPTPNVIKLAAAQGYNRRGNRIT